MQEERLNKSLAAIYSASLKTDLTASHTITILFCSAQNTALQHHPKHTTKIRLHGLGHTSESLRTDIWEAGGSHSKETRMHGASRAQASSAPASPGTRAASLHLGTANVETRLLNMSFSGKHSAGTLSSSRPFGSSLLTIYS